MLLIALEQLGSSPAQVLVTILAFSLALLTGLTFHEFSHAAAATALGDPTARRQGRLSLNPIAHLDPLGTTMIFLVGFGWARPVPVNPDMLRTRGPAGMAVVALAGPLSNVLLAAVAGTAIRAGLVGSRTVGFSLFHGQADDVLAYLVGSIVFWNLLLASFNLIPIAPLDGFRVALGALPREAAFQLGRLERQGQAILLLLIMSGFVIPGEGLLIPVIRPILNRLSTLVVGGHVW